MKANTNWYWQQLGTKEGVIIAICTIVHTLLDVLKIKYFADTPIILCNKKQARKAVQIHPIFISDADHDYILDEIER